jgi:hypothetical protein
MTNIRNELAKTARATIRDSGEKMVLRRFSSGSYNVDTGENTMTHTDYCARIAFARESRDETGSLIRTEQRRAYVALDDCQSIDTNDLIVGAGSSMKVSQIHDVFYGTDGGLLCICTLQG